MVRGIKDTLWAALFFGTPVAVITGMGYLIPQPRYDPTRWDRWCFNATSYTTHTDKGDPLSIGYGAGMPQYLNTGYITCSDGTTRVSIKDGHKL